MTNFVDVKINKKHTINLPCKHYQIGAWVDLLESRDYEVITIVKVRSRNVAPNTWNVIATKDFIDREKWEGYIG